MPGAKTNRLRIDPRTGLLLLVLATIIAFSSKSLPVELSTLGLLLFLTVLCGQVRSTLKWGAAIIFLFALQWYILPASPKVFAMSFSILVNYTRKMLPCLMIGGLLISTLSLREIIAALRSFRVPQKLIISISVTLRYFPAIKEEIAHIRDAMRLRNISGLEKVEATLVPLMISATNTAEELSAAAVTRGIENPAKKTSLIQLKMHLFDWIALTVGSLFTVAALVL